MCGVMTDESKARGLEGLKVKGRARVIGPRPTFGSPWDSTEWASGGVLLTWGLGENTNLADREFVRTATS
jgi:hypothetical protein